MRLPTITVLFNEQPIRIYNLPDKPVYDLRDLQRLLTISDLLSSSILHTPLEVQTIDKLKVVTTAGFFKLLFNSADTTTAIKLERFYLEALEPAIRKYGHPARTNPAG